MKASPRRKSTVVGNLVRRQSKIVNNLSAGKSSTAQKRHTIASPQKTPPSEYHKPHLNEVKFDPSVAELEILFNMLDRNSKGYVDRDDLYRVADCKNDNIMNNPENLREKSEKQ